MAVLCKLDGFLFTQNCTQVKLFESNKNFAANCLIPNTRIKF